MNTKALSIDESIERVEHIIQNHNRKSCVFLWTMIVFLVIVLLYFIFSISLSNTKKKHTDFNEIITLISAKNDSIFLDNYYNKLKKISEIKEVAFKNIEQDMFIEQKTNPLSNTDYINLLIYAFVLIITGIILSIYRFHLKEISKYEHYLIGFHRIRIAGNNSTSKYDDEVKMSLTRNAFELSNEKKEKINNPLPGHPTTEITTYLLNKIFDKLEISKKDDKKETPK
jgi:hypothetical protein